VKKYLEIFLGILAAMGGFGASAHAKLRRVSARDRSITRDKINNRSAITYRLYRKKKT